MAPTKKSKTVAYGSSVGYGTGSYDSQAHKGVGKEQKILNPQSGTDKGASPLANESPVKDNSSVTRSGQGGGYQKDAHSGTHHGDKGQAVGNSEDNRPFKWNSTLHGEGEEGKLGHVEYNTGGKAHGIPSGKAEHLPRPEGAAHNFPQGNSVSEAHGFGHGSSQRKGVLRMSGHSGAHRVGQRGKQ